MSFYYLTRLFAQRAVNGILDLSDVNLTGTYIELSGEWEFYWRELAHLDSKELKRKIVNHLRTNSN